MDSREIREYYNKAVPGQYEGDYEYGRWFRNPLLKAGYDMTRDSIKYHILDEKRLEFQDCLEMGPGPSTWTKILLEKNARASFDLVDISGEMLRIARSALSQYQNINFIESDFLDFHPNKKYDLFFSSRAFEYLPDKEKAVRLITSLLKPGGTGFVITKTPRYLRSRIIGQKKHRMHSGQIAPAKFEELVRQNDCHSVESYPVSIGLPIFKSPSLNKKIHRAVYRSRLHPVSRFLSESYCVKFRKP